MRVIAGEQRGMRLQAPQGRDVRPTSDRVREALFNILAPRIHGARFLDLFAGTGANGIEALSRGAESATFVDNATASIAAIRENLFHTKLNMRAAIFRLELPRETGKLSGTFDIVFADPPYAFDAYPALLEGLAAQGLVAEDGVVVIEHQRKAQLPESSGPLALHKQRQYGDTTLSLYA